MKTSLLQKTILVNFMETYGDLTKPTQCPQGKKSNKKFWEELVELLNEEPSGDARNLKLWKKYWCDLKSNTKKKAGRIHQHAIGTGGGPAITCQLLDYEEKVMQIMGPEAATGLEDVDEAGVEAVIFQSEENEESSPFSSEIFRIRQPATNKEATPPSINMSTAPLTPNQRGSTEEWSEPPTSQDPQATRISPAQDAQASSQFSPVQAPSRISPVLTPVPDFTPAASRRRRRPITPRRATPLRRPRPRTMNAAEQAASHFLDAERENRKHHMRIHEDHLRLENEKLRIRQLELNLYDRLGSRILDIAERFANKYL